MGKPETSVCRGDGSAPKSCFVRKLTDPQPKSTLLSNSGDAGTLFMISTVLAENRLFSAALKASRSTSGLTAAVCITVPGHAAPAGASSQSYAGGPEQNRSCKQIFTFYHSTSVFKIPPSLRSSMGV